MPSLHATIPLSADENAKATRRRLVLVLLFALTARTTVSLSTPDLFAADPDAYRHLARNVLEHGTYGKGDHATAYRPPLYPLFLIPCEMVDPGGRVAIGLLHLALGVATVWLVYRLGRAWNLAPGVSLVGAALSAVDPVLLLQSTLVMTETLATLLACWGLLMLTHCAKVPTWQRAALAGGCLALACLCRPTFLIWAGLAGFALPWFAAKGRPRLAVFLAYGMAGVLVMSPWMARNYRQFGRPIFATTHGGYTLLLGNNPSFYEHLRSAPWGSIWDDEAFNASWDESVTGENSLGEVGDDRRAYREARAAIAADPRMFVWSSLVRAGRLWRPWPHAAPQDGPQATAVRVAVGGWYVVLYGAAFAGVVTIFGIREIRSAWHRTWLWGLILAVTFTGVHAFYWSNMRMRGPLMPVVCLLSGLGMAAAWRWIVRRKSI